MLALFLSTLVIASRKNIIAHAFSPLFNSVPLRSNEKVSSFFCREIAYLKYFPQVTTLSLRNLSSKKVTTLSRSNSSDSNDHIHNESYASFGRGDKIQVEVTRFGRLGASVEVISHNSHDEDNIIPEGEPALGYGLILQKEIHYFREARDGLDVITGEILPAYVERVRDDGKLDISFRIPGGKGKAEDLANIILETLKSSEDKSIPVGDKSTPEDINRMFPGSSKASFKRAVAFLYKKRLVQPGPNVISLM